MYDFFRKVFNLPTNTTLCKYASSGSTGPDGLMMQTIIHVAAMYKKMNIARGDLRRRLNLGWDSHVIKDMLAFCPHTKRMVGNAHNVFDVDDIRKILNANTKSLPTMK